MSVEAASYFDAGALGDWTSEQFFRVDPDRTIAFARATNDDHPKHLDGTLAPPIFIVVPSRDPFIEARSQLLPRGLPPGVPPLLGKQDFRFLAPVVPGDTLATQAAPVGIHGKPSGTTLVLRVRSRNQRHEPVSEQLITLFFPRLTVDTDEGEEAPRSTVDPERLGPPHRRCALPTDADQTIRYSAASGDPSRMHLDVEVARSMGLPGIILHGLCTAAFVARAVITTEADGDPTRLARLSVTFSRPVFPGETIETRLWRLGADNGRRTYAVIAESSSGQTVIRDGLAEVRAA